MPHTQLFGRRTATKVSSLAGTNYCLADTAADHKDRYVLLTDNLNPGLLLGTVRRPTNLMLLR